MHTSSPLRLGEILISAGLLDEAALERVLDLQKTQDMPLGELMVHELGVSRLDVSGCLAQQQGMYFVNLVEHPPEAQLLSRHAIGEYLAQQMIPWRKDADGRLMVAVCAPSLAMELQLAKYFGCDVALVMTSPRDIVFAIEQHFASYLGRLARTQLHATTPQYSAIRQGKYRRQFLAWAGAGVALLAVMVQYSSLSAMVLLLGFSHVVYLVLTVFRAMLAWQGVAYLRAHVPKESTAFCDARALPVYSVLVPLYDEAECVPALIEAMKQMDYPRSKLDIKLIVEASDAATQASIKRARPPAMFEMVVVPPMKPRTKPKACNYAMRFVRGSYVVIYDAEDRPDPQQLKMAVAGFASVADDVVCLQAKLGYYNRDDNMLTRWFSLEYGLLFGLLLGGLARLGMPLPLGGTSNHFRVDALRKLGEWDAYNVTEDADLGVRLAAQGYKTALLDAWTWEESPNRFGVWLRQRSRWIKGYMQTWSVHMRHPICLYQQIGLKGFVGFQLFFAMASLGYLLAPILWVVMLWSMTQTALQGVVYTGASGAWCVLGCGVVVQWVTAWMACVYVPYCRYKRSEMLGAVVSYPLYGLLHALASFRAVWQFIRRPYVWDKTPHGLYKQSIFTT